MFIISKTAKKFIIFSIMLGRRSKSNGNSLQMELGLAQKKNIRFLWTVRCVIDVT